MGYGQGSITQDPRNGKWKARYRGPDKKQRCKSFKRKTDAQAFLAAMLTDKSRGTWIDPKGGTVPFDEWVWEWFRGQHGLGETAKRRDESLLRRHVIPAFGSAPIARISPLDARSFVNDLVAKGLSPATVRLCFRLFSSAMRGAAEARMIPDLVLTRRVVVLPTIQRKRERVLDEDELELLVGCMDPSGHALTYTAAYTGARWGELAGLKRAYLELDKAKLHIRGTLEKVPGGYRYKERPKSDAGRRSLAIPARLVQILTAHLEGAELDEWVFSAPGGGSLDHSNFSRRIWKPAVEKAGLAPLTFHDLRHTHAAWLIREGVQALAISRRLGHGDIRTTMNVYGHLFPNHEADLVDMLDRRWSAAKEESAKVIQLNA